MMLYLLQHHASPPEPPIAGLEQIDALVRWLAQRVAARLDLALPDGGRSPEDVASQFGWQILIQPNVLGGMQFSLQEEMMSEGPTFDDYLLHPEDGFDSYDIRRSVEDPERIFGHVEHAMRDPAMLATMLGVPLAQNRCRLVLVQGRAGHANVITTPRSLGAGRSRGPPGPRRSDMALLGRLHRWPDGRADFSASNLRVQLRSADRVVSLVISWPV